MFQLVLVGDGTAGRTPVRLKLSRDVAAPVASRDGAAEGFRSGVSFVSKRRR